MRAKKVLLALIGLMCINTSVQGEEWKLVKCLQECTNISCIDSTQKQTCQTNCANHLDSIDACRKAKPQGSSPRAQPNSRPAGRGLPKPVDPIQPTTPPEPKGEPEPSQSDLETRTGKTTLELDKGGNQPPPKKERSRPQAHRLSKPPLEAAETKASHSQKLREPSVEAKTETAKEAQEGVSQGTELLKAQVDMLKEAVKQAEVCYQMGRDVAKEAAKDPIKFEEDIKSEERGKDSIFPNVYVSIFDKNPNFVTDTLDPTKMDQQSFVFHLKEQRKTIGVNLADMLKEILSWSDASKIEKYKKDISGDLRALSSFCNAPTLMLRQAIKHKQEQLKEAKLREEHLAAKALEKKPNIFSRAKNKVLGN